LNIPSTVTFIGYYGIYLYRSFGGTQNLPVFIEFEPRTSDLYIDGYVFCGRSLYQIYYPSSIVPLHNSNGAFCATTTAYICAPSVFNFYTKTTTTDLSKCPDPLFVYKPQNHITSIAKIKARLFKNVIIAANLIVLCSGVF